MKRLLGLLLITALLACLCPGIVPAQEKEKPADQKAPAMPQVEVVSVQVNKPFWGHGMGLAGSRSGTSLGLRIVSPDTQIISFDQQASRLEVLVDDRGTDLIEPESKPFGWKNMQHFMASSYPGDKPGQQQWGVQVGGDGVPVPGATKVILKATLVVRCGQKEATVEKKDLNLKEGAKLDVGILALEVRETEALKGPSTPWRPAEDPYKDSKTWIRLSATEPLDAIKAVAWLGPDGKEIKSHHLMNSTQGNNKGTTYSRTYGLAEKIEKVGVKIVYYDDIETVRLPLSIETGVGF